MREAIPAPLLQTLQPSRLPLAVGGLRDARQTGCDPLKHGILGRQRALFVLLVIAGWLAMAFTGPSQAQETDAREGPPRFVFLNSPEDLDRLLEQLSSPDFVVVDWARYKALLDQAARMRDPVGPVARVASVRGMTLRGTIAGPSALLEATFEILSEADGRVEVPVRLDGLVLTEATEGERVVPVASTAGAGWSVEVEGRGLHHVVIRFLAPVHSSSEGQRLDVGIPEAGATRVELDSPTPMVDPRLDTGESLSADPARTEGIRRLAADLSSRSLLSLRWRAPLVREAEEKPSLLARGEILLAVDERGADIEASYDLTSERGEAESVELSVDPGLDAVRTVVDNVPVNAERLTAREGNVWRISLGGGLRPGSTRRLTVRARKAMPSGWPGSWRFDGFPMEGVESQVGLIGVAALGEIHVSGENGRGLATVNPRTEISRGVLKRGRPTLGFRFHEQPFELRLSASPAPPWVRVGSRTTVSLTPMSAQVDAWLDYRISQGRVGSVAIEIPPGLVLDSLGPDSVIDSAEMTASEIGAAAGGPRAVTVRLSEEAIQNGSFELHLSGRCRILPSQRVEVPIFQVVKASQWTGEALLAASPQIDATVENTTDYSPSEPRSLAAWSRAGNDGPANVAPLAWLSHGPNPPPLTLALKLIPRRVTGRARADVTIEPSAIELREEFDLEVSNGSLDQIDLQLPADLLAELEIEGLEIARRRPLEALPDGRGQVRLQLSRPLTGRGRLSLRARREGSELGAAPTRQEVSLGPVTIADVPIESNLTRLLADVAIELDPVGDGWRESDRISGRDETGLAVCWVRVGKGEPTAVAFRAGRRAAAQLPTVVISRMVVRTQILPEGSVRALVLCALDRHDGELQIELPRSARWVRARLGESAITEIEELDQPSLYRLRLGRADPSAKRVAALEYAIPEQHLDGRWIGPRFPPMCQVMQSFWEVRLPWNRAVLGVPANWFDENEWYWDRYVWKRRPRHTGRELEAWVNGGGATRSSPAIRTLADVSSDEHSYVFSRPGTIRGGSLWIAMRPIMVAICSGTVLLIGLVALLWRARLRLYGLLVAIVLAALAVTWHPSLALQFLQSATVGVALLVIAAVLHRLVAPKTRPITEGPEVVERPTSSFAQPASARAAGEGGGDESTVIRQRASSTVDGGRPEAGALAASSTTGNPLPLPGES